MEKRKVVVTGMGMITPLGNTTPETWVNMVRGNSGISLIDWKKTDNLPKNFPRVQGRINADLVELIEEKAHWINKVARMDRFSQLAILAAVEAISQSQMQTTQLHETGVVIGSSFGGAETWESGFLTLFQGQRVSACTIPSYFPNMAAANIAIAWDCHGPNECASSACASGASSIGRALRMIQWGECTTIIAGGAEAALTPLVTASFHATKALTSNSNPVLACRPFDKKRDGFVLSEGAAILVLEEEQQAIRRGAEILARITGFGSSCDAHSLVEPTIEGPVLAMERALKDAGLAPGLIDLINAHATSTQKGDVNEIKALSQIFRDTCEKPWITANKSQLGHCLGAAGAIEATTSIASIIANTVPPILGLQEIDKECSVGDFIFVSGADSISANIKRVLSNSSGFGGINTTLIFEKYE